MVHFDIKEGFDRDHFVAHVIGPFQDLRLDVGKECYRGSEAKDHNISYGNLVDVAGHGNSRTNELVSNFVPVKCEGCLFHQKGSMPCAGRI